MNQGKSGRLRVGLLTLPISGVLGAVVLLLRGPIVFPLTAGSDWIGVVSSTNFLLYQNLLAILYVLPFVGFLALHGVLARDVRVWKSSFVGLILTLWGTALALPALGIASFVTSLAGQAGSADQARIGQIVTEAITGSGMLIGIVAAVLYTTGPILFGVAIWRKGGLSRIAAILFATHGALLSFGFSFFPALILGWILLAISGILISLDVRKESQS
ncbi:MAG: hypothetical protein MUQ10_13130 [Anaerolineae bacterium]|nr:hypothetical protein [Anaerolineae bacterium]